MKQKEKIVLDFGDGKKVNVEGEVCSNPFSQARGLMFRHARNSPILIFNFKREVKEPIHSFFVFYNFFAVWLDSDGEIMEIRKVKPFSPYIPPRKNFRTLVEIPFNKKNREILDDIEKFK